MRGKLSPLLLAYLALLLMLLGTQINFDREYRFWFKDADNNFSPEVISQLVGAIWQYSENAECNQHFAADGFDGAAWRFCYSANTDRPTIILLGNSHANSLVPGVISAARDRFGVLSMGACDLTGTIIFENKNHPCSADNFDKGFQQILASIQQLEAIAIVVDGLEVNPSPEYLVQLRQKLLMLAHHTDVLMIVEPHFKPEMHPRLCFSRPFVDATHTCKGIPYERDAALRVYETFLADLQGSLEVSLLEVNDFVCNESLCDVIDNGLPFYRDEVHISEYLSLEIGPRLIEHILARTEI